MTSNPIHKRIIILGGTPEIFKIAIKLGLETIYIQKPNMVNMEILSLCKRSIISDYQTDSSIIDLLKSMYKKSPFDCVISFTESAQLITAILNKELGLPGIDPYLVKLVNDKSEMRRLINDFSPVNSAVVHTKEEILQFANSNGFPFIIKPKTGVGSTGIKLISNNRDINDLIVNDEMLAEDYLIGTEYSVESFSFNGEHVVIAITEKKTFDSNDDSKYVEEAHKIPAILPVKQEEIIQEYIVNFLSVINFKDGPAHTEIILTKHGPKIVETHTRPGGDYIPELISYSHNVNLYEMSINWFSHGHKPKLNNLKYSKGASIKFLKFSPGKVSKIMGIDKIKELKDIIRFEVNIEQGDYITMVSKSSERAGYLIAVGNNSEDAYETCERAANCIKVAYERIEEEIEC